MRINRDQLLNDLYDYSRSGNGLVLGSPGAGKSYSLIELNKMLMENKVPVLQISVDQLGAATPDDIKSFLGIDKTLSEKLKSEYSDSQNPAVLIIDGFDAARNLEIQSNLLALIKDLINTLQGSWNILVSVRSFDAKKSRDLLKLFPQKKNNKSKYLLDIECENFFIPPLTDEEVLSVESEISGLKRLYESATEEFKEILRNPFNLWLLKKISIKNESLSGLDEIGSEIQLLDKFWHSYVSSAPDSDKKESILSALSHSMVTEYSLSVKKEKHYKAELDSLWKSLFSDEIIVASELTGQRISFSHNILFDYAVSLLVIDEKVEEVVSFLTEEPARALFLRPSLTYYYARLWFAERSIFWDSFAILLKSENQNLRIFARIVPASVAVRLFITSDDFKELDCILKKNISDYKEIVTRILQAYDFLGSRHNLEWLKFFKYLTSNVYNEYIWSLAKLTNNILDNSNEDDHNLICGEIGRNLLGWIWSNRNGSTKAWLDGIGANFIIPIVAKTFGSNPVESEKIIRKVLEVIKEDNFPIQYIYRLTNDMDHIWPTSPSLVGDIYRVVFSYKELSQEQTSMGTPVMPLLSNRKQDFQMCHYHLVKKYPSFIEAAPLIAINAGIDCLNAYIWQEHVHKDGSKEEQDEHKTIFTFRGKESVINRDWSYIWDGRGSHRDEQIKIASTIFEFIGKSLSDDTFLNSVLDLFSHKAIVAFWWKRLLALGTRYPEQLASPLFDLCLVEQIVDGIDTEYEAVDFIIASWSFFTIQQREKFQNFLMALNSDDEDQQKYILILKEKVISKLSKDTLTNELAIDLKNKLDSQGRDVENRPPYSISTGWGGPYTDEDFLKDQGTDVNDSDIKTLLSARSNLTSVTSDLLNGKPSKEQVTSILKESKKLHALLSPKAITNDKPSLNMAWRELANSVEILCRTEIDFGSSEYLYIKEILLICAELENPYPKENADEEFTSAAYSPYAKTEVAQALPWFARFGRDEDILSAIIKMAKCQEPEARYLLCREIWRIRGPYLTELWNILEDRAKQEKNAVVLGALAYSLSNTFYNDHAKGELILIDIYNSFSQLNFSDEDIKGTFDIILWLHLEEKSSWATGVINTITNNPKENIDKLSIVISDLLQYLIPKTLEEKPKLFQAAKSTILNAIPHLWKDVGSVYEGISDKSSKDEIESAKSLYYSIDNIITRLYFAADVSTKLRNRNERALSDEVRRAYYFEIKSILKLVLDESIKSKSPTVFAPTAHHFMELISGVLSYDVSGVLKMAADLVSVSESSNYNLDSMAMSEVVKLTESVLADHRSELQNNENITNLLKLLDSFAKTGWSDALKLVWRLDEIYR